MVFLAYAINRRSFGFLKLYRCSVKRILFLAFLYQFSWFGCIHHNIVYEIHENNQSVTTQKISNKISSEGESQCLATSKNLESVYALQSLLVFDRWKCVGPLRTCARAIAMACVTAVCDTHRGLIGAAIEWGMSAYYSNRPERMREKRAQVAQPVSTGCEGVRRLVVHYTLHKQWLYQS